MTPTLEQIKEILANVPDGATHYNITYGYLKSARSGYMVYCVDGGDWDYEYTGICETHALSDLRTIAQQAEEIERLKEQVPQWVSVDERTPPIDTWFLWLDGNETMTPYRSDCHIDKINKRGECLVSYTHNYTHWMPLPQPPKEKDDER